VRASSACERVLGVRPDGVKAPEERKEPSVGGIRDGRGVMVARSCQYRLKRFGRYQSIEDMNVLEGFQTVVWGLVLVGDEGYSQTIGGCSFLTALARALGNRNGNHTHLKFLVRFQGSNQVLQRKL
jgi:hypothetical protein